MPARGNPPKVVLRDEWISATHACMLLGITQPTLRAWITKKKLKLRYRELGDVRRYSRADLETWLTKNTHGEPA